MKRDNKILKFIDLHMEGLMCAIAYAILVVFIIFSIIHYSESKDKLMVCDHCNKVIETGVDDYLVTPKGEHYHADCYMHVLKEEKK